MNKAITDGLNLTPPPFADGLDVWSRGDGTPGTATYDGYATAGFVPADQDFAGCLEVLKTEPTQTLRYMGQTPLLPGCYLRITARVKAIAGNLPVVRIAGFAADQAGAAVPGLVLSAPPVSLTSYGEIVEVSAIVGAGARSGVDLVWGAAAVYGHFGLNLEGPNGGVVRIDDLQIEDITGAFHRDLMDWVDVTDFGAIGDGVTDNVAAFEAADAAAQGRSVLVPEGSYRLEDNVSFENSVRFHGTLIMDDDKSLILRENFSLTPYVEAFGDEVTGFKKAFQALLLGSDHVDLDMDGRSIAVSEPIDMQAALAVKDVHAVRRVIRHGQFNAQPSSGWDTGLVTSDADYTPSNPLRLTGVTNVANIEVGSLITGTGVGREVYVTSRDIGGQSLEISRPLHGASGRQSYSFTRFRYILDFSGFSHLAQLNIADIDFQCDGEASAVMLSKQGLIWQFRDTFFKKPKDRGITSPGRACQGMLIDNCQFLSNEQPLRAQDRRTIGLNINANDVKLRENRAVKWGHWAIIHGSGHMIQSNHFFQGDFEPDGTRQAGLVLTSPNGKNAVVGNYVDNCFIEWNNEHDEAPEMSNEWSFGSLSITGNIFTVARVGPWFRWIVVKPFGPDHFINGLTVTGNTFRAQDGNIDRVEKLDDSIAALNPLRFRNITWSANTYHGVDQWTMNPAVLRFTESAASTSWDCDFAGYLPFNGQLRNVTSVMPNGPLKLASGTTVYVAGHADTRQGSGATGAALKWPQAVQGTVFVTGRADNPF